jgi:hypothetical protein
MFRFVSLNFLYLFKKTVFYRSSFITHKLRKSNQNMFISFNLQVALFALVAVAAAEPQWVHPYGVHYGAHLKTPSGDTVSVQAAKIQHHQLKAAEYAKKAYLPYSYQAGVVAAPISNVYNVPATYAAHVPATYAAHVPATYGAHVPATYAAATYPYTSGVYSGIHSGMYSGVHHLGKREAEAEADSQYYTNAYAGVHPYYNNAYNTGVYGAYSGLTAAAPVYKSAASVYNVPATYGGYTGYTGFPYTTYGNVKNRFHY